MTWRYVSAMTGWQRGQRTRPGSGVRPSGLELQARRSCLADDPPRGPTRLVSVDGWCRADEGRGAGVRHRPARAMAPGMAAWASGRRIDRVRRWRDVRTEPGRTGGPG